METRICENCGAKMTAIKTDKKVTSLGNDVKTIETYIYKCQKCQTTSAPIQKEVSKEEDKRCP